MIDVQRLHRFLVDKNRAAARRAVRAIRHGVKILGHSPQAGRAIVSFDPEYRELVIPFGGGAYLVYYRCDESEVILLRVRHGRESGY